MQNETENSRITMKTSYTKFEETTFASQISRLKDERVKLEELAKKVISTKQDLINSNLSGETYNKSISINEYCENEINNRIIDLNSLISKLEVAYNEYMECINDTSASIK